jgi:hypothetical protein
MVRLDELDEILQIRIQSCILRLKGSVNVFDVLNWLSNFKKTEYSMALAILSKLEYFNEKEVIELLQLRLAELDKLVERGSNIIIHPIGEYGKSGTLLIYYLKKTPFYKAYSQRIRFYETYNVLKYKKKKNEIPANSFFVLLDDFFGSGKSFISYYSTYVEPHTKGNKDITATFILSLFYLNRAGSLIASKYKGTLTLIGEKREACFHSAKSVFGYRDRMLPYREFCFSYGKHMELFSITNEQTGEKTIYPLGYENSQALIVFPYNPPNNTLPIIWSANNNWVPLYPRVAHVKISTAKKYRSSLAYELGLESMVSDYEMAKTFRSGHKDVGWKSFSFITKTDFAVFSIMKLLRQGRAEPIICQILGITSEDFERYIKEGQSKGIFSPDRTLTEYGLNIYLDKLKRLKSIRTQHREMELDFKVKNVNYVPKTFRGRP